MRGSVNAVARSGPERPASKAPLKASSHKGLEAVQHYSFEMDTLKHPKIQQAPLL